MPWIASAMTSAMRPPERMMTSAIAMQIARKSG